MNAQAGSRQHHLDIHVRRVARGDSNDDVDISIDCPRLVSPVPLDDCVSCTDCGGLSLDPTGRESFLLCRYSGDEPKVDAATARRVSRPLRETPAARTPVSSIMTRNVVCVEPELSVERLAQILIERNISGVPVIDRGGSPIGIVTKTDLLRERFDDELTRAEPEELLRVRLRHGDLAQLPPGFHEERLPRATVREIMTPVAFTLPDSASVAEAAALMTQEGVHRLPVVDAGGKVVGILSAMDVLRWTAGVA